MNTFEAYNKVLSEKEQALINKTRASVVGGPKGSDYPEPIAGIYIAQIARLGIVPHKTKGVPCFDLIMNLIQGMDDDTKAFMANWPGKRFPKIFRKLPLVGTRNDESCIGSATGLASRLYEGTDIRFNGNFDELARDVAELAGKIDESFAYLIEYDPSDFNRIKVQEILRNNPVQEQAAPVPETNNIPQFDSKGYIPLDETGMPQAAQAHTSYPFPDSDAESEWLDSFTDEEYELPFN